MKSTTIIELMTKDHLHIVKHLNEVESNIDADHLTLLKVFDQFNWHLEKHFFTEEKALFTEYEPENTTSGYAMLPQLIKEHTELLNTANNMRHAIRKRNTPTGFLAFKQQLMKHKTFEETEVYPKLDQNLTDQQKQAIINKITEIVE